LDEKQRRLIEYFNNLRDPIPPPSPPGEVDVEEGAFESVAPPPAAVEPPRPTLDSVRKMLEKRRSAGQEGAAVEESVHAGAEEEIEEGFFEAMPATGGGVLHRPAPVERPITEQELEVGLKATEKVLKGDELDLDEQDVFEAIILPGKRPVLDISGDDFSEPPHGWEFLTQHREVIRRALPSIGRIDVPELLTIPYAGTGFFVGPGILMTNRHVARLLVQGVGAGSKYLTFLADRSSVFDPKYEVGAQGAGTDRYEVVEPLLVHPHWDVALFRVRSAEGKPLPRPLRLARRPPPEFQNGALQHVVVVGYPTLDTRNDDPVEIEQQMNIFRKIFGRKRLMPGYLTGYRDQKTKWAATLHATTHDASTLGGASGSSVVDLTTGIVLSLHFGGKYLQTNFGCPTWELARDQRIVDLGVEFVDYAGAAPAAEAAAPIWLKSWDSVAPLVAEESAAAGGIQPAPAPSGGGAPPLTTESPALPVAPDWFERVSDTDLVEAMRRDRATTERLIRETLLPREADDLISDLRRGLQTPAEVTEEEGIFDFLTGGPKIDPSLPEIIFLHGIMGSHLAAYGSLGGRIWLSPLAFAAGSVAGRLTLGNDGERDLNSEHVLYPDGHIRLVYEKAARKWRGRGYVVHEFAFDWRKSIANSADRLHLFIESLRLERPAKKFALVGHSMGGLVATLYAARHPEWSARVTQSIFLGSPLRGSYVPIEALLGTYPLFPKFALADRLDDIDSFISMARTLPGLLDMLPDPELFPDAAPLYQRATWPEASAPAQMWLDQSRQVKRLLATSPVLETARLIVSPEHPTVGEVTVVGGKLQPGARNRPGDGTVPTRSAAGLAGVAVYRATYSHGDLPREPSVIEAVDDLLRNGTCRLPPLTQQAINDTTPVEESVFEGIEEALTAANLGPRLRSGIFTQRDVDFLLRADHSTVPGPINPSPVA
jgi:pimeloyl-ACP methyl ester carboxylesterase